MNTKSVVGLSIIAALISAACSKDNTIDASQSNTTECGDDAVECTPCEAGELTCDGKTLRQCRETGVGYEALSVCVSEELCVLGLTDGVCAAPVCGPNERSCGGSTMSVCKSGRDGFETVVCGSAQECQDGLAGGLCGQQCTKDGDCQGETSACRKPACDKGRCVIENEPKGTAIAQQTPQDCQKVVCDGSGGTSTEADESDAPANTECATWTCNGSTPEVSHASQGTTCEGDGECDGNGGCVVCAPGEVDGCVDSTTQRKCTAAGFWGSSPCPATKQRCDTHDGQCYGGSAFVWVPDGQGGTYGIDRTEVTRGQYSDWLDHNPSIAAQPPLCSFNSGFVPSCDWPPGAESDYPVVCVDWCDAVAYCTAVGKRLCGAIGGSSIDYNSFNSPAISQWMRVCTANGEYDYPYGDVYDGSACNGADRSSRNCGTSTPCPGPVGSIATCESADVEYAGVFDLSGNVNEWVDSCNGIAGGADPCRIHGGSYKDQSVRLRCAHTGSAGRSNRTNDLGFRCCSL